MPRKKSAPKRKEADAERAEPANDAADVAPALLEAQSSGNEGHPAPEAAHPEDLDALLLSMKNTSELMVDLAYSALLYANRDIALEVMELEEAVDAMNERMDRGAFEAHKRGEVATDRALAYVKLAQAAELIADAASEIADVIVRGVELHPVIRISVQESDVTIARVVVESASPLDGRTIGDMHVATETGMKIIAIRRGRQHLYGPKKTTEIHAGDMLYARGPPEGEKNLRELATGPAAAPDAE